MMLSAQCFTKIGCHLLAVPVNLESWKKTPLQTWKYPPAGPQKEENHFRDICIMRRSRRRRRSTQHGFVFAMLHCFDAVGTWPPRSIDRIGRPNDGYTSRKVLHACAEPASKPPVLEGGKVKVSGNPQGVWLFLVSSKTGWKKSW